MSRFRAVAWDIDGTLIDSEALHQRALVQSSAFFGVDLSNLPHEAFRGVHMHDVWKALEPRFPKEVERKAWLSVIERRYVSEADGLPLSPGALETVRALTKKGVPQACVSNSGRAVVDANLDALGIRDAIAFSISLNDVSKGKPDPEPFREAARRFGLPPASVVAVEDGAAAPARREKRASMSSATSRAARRSTAICLSPSCRSS